MKQLGEMMGDLGFAFDKTGAHFGGVIEVYDLACKRPSRICVPPASTS
jgi:hypothetical protein